MHGDLIINELKEELSNGKGCVLLDLACYFPYLNQEEVIFQFKFGEELLEPYKLNHRYLNTNFLTISKKVGRKISKIGYPLFLDLDNKKENNDLEIIVGFKDEICQFIFPIQINLTKEYPVCALSFHFYFDDKKVKLTSARKCDNGEWQRTVWSNKKVDGIIFLIELIRKERSVMYENVLTPYPQKLEDLLVL